MRVEVKPLSAEKWPVLAQPRRGSQRPQVSDLYRTDQPGPAKRVDELQAVADALSLLVNIVMAWNTSQMQAVLDRWANRRQHIPSELIEKIAPTRLESINFRRVFRFPIDRYAGQILPSKSAPLIDAVHGTKLPI